MHHLLMGVVCKVHLIKVSRKLFRQTGCIRETEGEKQRREYEFNRGKHARTHKRTNERTHTCFISLKAKAGLALFDKIINRKRMEEKTLQTAVNYDPGLEVDVISEGWRWEASVIFLE